MHARTFVSSHSRDIVTISLRASLLGKDETGPCPGPQARARASVPLCDTAAFLSSSFHVTAKTVKFCSRYVIYMRFPAVGLGDSVGVMLRLAVCSGVTVGPTPDLIGLALNCSMMAG